MQYKELRGDVPLAIAVPYLPATGVGGGGFVAPYNLVITAAKWTAAAAITGAATNFFTLSFFNRGAAGAGTVQWATAIAYSSGGVTATKGASNALTLSSTASDLLVAAGDNLVAEVTSAGTGMICPGGVVMLTVRAR